METPKKKDAMLLRDVCKWISTAGLLRNPEHSTLLSVLADVLSEDLEDLYQKELFN